MKLGDAGSGEEGLKKLGKRTADEESLDGEGPGGADAADSSSTKRDGQTPRASGAPAPPRGLPTPSPPGQPPGPAPFPKVQRATPEQEAQEGRTLCFGQWWCQRFRAARKRK